MTINNELAAKLIKTWGKVEKDYRNELINSERCLQAILYMHFRKILSKDYKIYVEAEIESTKKKNVKPDIVICKNTAMKRKIKCIIEIKYAPHLKCYLTDMDKLQKLQNLYKHKDKKCDIFIYGPDKRSIPDTPTKWEKEHWISHEVDKDTIFLFVLIAQEEMFGRDLIKPFLDKKNNYMLAAKTFSDKPIKFSNDLKLRDKDFLYNK